MMRQRRKLVNYKSVLADLHTLSLGKWIFSLISFICRIQTQCMNTNRLLQEI